MAEEAKVNTEWARSIAEADADIDATIRMKKPKPEPKPARAICVKCGKPWPTSLMALVGMDCWECRRCLYA